MAILVSGCNKSSKEQVIWYEDMELAIEKHLENLGATELNRIEIDNNIETLIFYRLNQIEGMGLSSVVYHTNQGYQVKQIVYPLLVNMVQLDYVSNSGETILLTLGKAPDKKQKSIILEGVLRSYNLPVFDGYYFDTNLEPFYRYKSQ